MSISDLRLKMNKRYEELKQKNEERTLTSDELLEFESLEMEKLMPDYCSQDKED